MKQKDRVRIVREAGYKDMTKAWTASAKTRRNTECADWTRRKRP